MSAANTVSLRAAASAIGVAKSTLSQLLRRERTLAAAVVGRGSRGSLQIDLEQLRSAWAQLQGPEPSVALSARAAYEAERRRYLWWQLQGLVGEVEDQASRLANAAELKQIPGPAGDNRLGAKVIGSIPNILYCRSKITFNITIKVFLNVLLFLVFCFHGDGYKPCNISGEDLTIFVYSTAQFM